jgi:hypothetical protein
MEKTKDINEIKVGNNVKTFDDSTIFIGVEDKIDYSLDCSGYEWNYKTSYCSNDYVILDMGGGALYLLCNYSSIIITDECNK